MEKTSAAQFTTYEDKSSAFDEEGARLQNRARSIFRTLNFLLIVSRVVDLVSSTVSVGLMSFNLAKYYKTLHVTNGNQNLWSAATLLYPNFLTLASAAITFTFGVIVLTAYRRGREVALRWDERRATIGKILFVIKIGSATASTLAMWITRNHAHTLSGQTCTAPAGKQPYFPQVNFAQFCVRQDLTAGLMALEALAGILSAIAFLYGYMGKRTDKKMGQLTTEENMAEAPISTLGDTKT